MKEIRGLTVEFVSYVRKGANKKKFFLKKDAENAEKSDVEKVVRIIVNKTDDQQLIYGIVYEPDVKDAHDDFMTAPEIEKTAHEFLTNYRQVDAEHNQIDGAGEVVESYIAPVEMTINEEVISKGSWILVTKADDETWELVTSGEYTGYSMWGFAEEKVEVAEEKTFWQKVAKFFGIEINKDFNSEFANDENNNVDRLLSILNRVIWKADWNLEGQEKKDEIIKNLKQMIKKVQGMSFELAKTIEGEEMKPEEIVELVEKTLKEKLEGDEFSNTITTAVTAAIAKSKEPVVKKTAEEIAADEAAIKKAAEETTEESETVQELVTNVATLTGSLAKIEKALLDSGAIVVDDPDKKTIKKNDIGLKANML